MPKGFDACVRQKGQVRRISGPNSRWKVPAGYYRNICFLKSGKTYKGYLHRKDKK